MKPWVGIIGGDGYTDWELTDQSVEMKRGKNYVRI